MGRILGRIYSQCHVIFHTLSSGLDSEAKKDEVDEIGKYIEEIRVALEQLATPPQVGLFQDELLLALLKKILIASMH